MTQSYQVLNVRKLYISKVSEGNYRQEILIAGSLVSTRFQASLETGKRAPYKEEESSPSPICPLNQSRIIPTTIINELLLIPDMNILLLILDVYFKDFISHFCSIFSLTKTDTFPLLSITSTNTLDYNHPTHIYIFIYCFKFDN